MRHLGIALAVCLTLGASGAQAASVRLQWDPNTEPDLAGYKVHYGLASRSYATTIDSGMLTTMTVPLPDDGNTYYLAVTAYDTVANESGYSNEVAFTTPLAAETVSAPEAPTGPTDIATGLPYVFTTGGAASSHGHELQYRFHWADGTLSEWLPVGQRHATKSWAMPGVYTLVRAEARCALHPTVVSPASGALSVTVSASPAETVSRPAAPAGETAATTFVAYTYTAGGAASSLGDPVQYRFIWNDGSVSEWLPLGVRQATKAWGAPGVYTPQVEARCSVHGTVTSSPSEPLTVAVAGSATETVTPPAAPEGPLDGQTGYLYRYVSRGAVSTGGDPVQYRFQWGDGTVSAWLTPDAAGEVQAWKSWPAEGTYSVVTEARCALHPSVASLSSPVTMGIIGGGSLIFYDTFVDGTAAGDPQWRKLSGRWRVTAGKTYASVATKAVNRTVVAGIAPVAAGRLAARVKLTPAAARNGAGLIFAADGDRRYRYVFLQGSRLSVGQVGETQVSRAGVKAARKVRLAPGRWHQIRLDLRPDGRVDVFLGAQRQPALTARFADSLGGSVGVAANRAVAYFDDFKVWDRQVFP